MNSSDKNYSSKFIPILTEVIDGPAQANLDLPLDEAAVEKSQGSKEPVLEADQGAVNFFMEDFEDELGVDIVINTSAHEAAPQTQPQASAPAQSLASPASQPLAIQKTAHATTDWQDRPSMPVVKPLTTPKKDEPKAAPKPVTKPVRDAFQAVPSSLKSTSTDDFQDDETPIFADTSKDDEELFSPLSRNPMSQDDQVRPSDLMLLALTERIASKVRMRVSKDLDAHIQTKIFPLLDQFADQLVKNLEVDLLKLIREGIAEATREELERLSQRNKK